MRRPGGAAGRRRRIGPGFRCVACERPAALAVPLGYMTDDGEVGELSGFACRRCGHLREALGARPIRIFGHLDLGGQSAADFFLGKLAAAGCLPTEPGAR